MILRRQVLYVFWFTLSAVFGDHTNSNSISDSYPTTAVVLQDFVKSYQDPAFSAYHVAFVLWMLLVVHWMRLPPNHQSPMLQRFAWGVSGGSVTGLQHFVKDWLTLVHAMVRSHNDRLVDTHDDDHDIDIDDIDCNSLWCNPLLVLSILALLSMMTAIGGLLLLTACMQRYNATFSSAMFVGSFVLNSSIMSAVHYHTFSHLNSRVCWILYPVGLLILMAGVVGILVSSSLTPSLSSLSNGPEESQNNAVDESLHGLLLMASHNDTMKQDETPNVPNDNDDRCCHSPLQLFRSLQETRGKYLVVNTTMSETGDDGLDPEKCVSKYGTCG